MLESGKNVVIKNIPLWERAFGIIFIILSTAAILNLIRTGGVADQDIDSTGDSPLVKIVWSICYVGAALLLFKTKNFWMGIRSNYLLVALSLIAFSSILWSDYPDIALRFIVSLLGCTLFAYYFGLRYDLIEMLQLTVQALFIVAVLSAITAIALPQYGVMHDSGALNGNWRGIYSHKNTFGRAMTIMVIICYVLFNYEKKQKYIWYSIFGIGLIVMSRSSTSLATIFMIYCWGFYLKTIRIKTQKLSYVIITAVPILLLVGLFIINYDVILSSMGKDPTLTGRTALWHFLIPMAMKRAVLGYGMGSFWIGDRGPSGIVWSNFYWAPGEAHNGYLDLVLSIGLVGAVIFVFLFLSVGTKYYVKLIRDRDKHYFWGTLLLSFIFVYNFSESSLLRNNNLLWILFISTLVSYNVREKRGYITVYNLKGEVQINNEEIESEPEPDTRK